MGSRRPEPKPGARTATHCAVRARKPEERTLFTIGISAELGTYAVHVEVSTGMLGPGEVVMQFSVLERLVGRAVACLADRSTTSERIAEQVGSLVAEQLAILPPELGPAPPAALRVRVQRGPNAWTAFDRVLLPTPAMRRDR